MFFLKKIFFYLSPLLCLLLLLAAGVIKHRSERLPPSAQAVPKELRIRCDKQLEAPVTAIMEAFQRRHLVTTTLVIASPDQNQVMNSNDITADIVISLVYDDDDAGSTPDTRQATRIAALRPVILATAAVAQHIHDWPDLPRAAPRLALSRRHDTALGRCSAEVMMAHGIAWQEIHRNAVFQSDGSFVLAQAVAMGKADGAILWESDATYFSQVATVLRPPMATIQLAAVTLAVDSQKMMIPGVADLRRFFQNALAAEIFHAHGYLTMPSDQARP